MRFLITLLLCAPFALAGDDCGACEGGDCGDCKGDAKVAKADCKADCGTKCSELASARKELDTWKGELKGLSRVERNALKAAEKTLAENDAATKALAPTFGAAADSMALLAALESAVSEKSAVAKLAHDMSKTYRAMAQAIAGDDSYKAPALGTAEELKAAIKKCEAHAKAVEAMWKKAGEAKRSDEVKTAMKLVAQASPRMRALAMNANTAGDAFVALKCTKAEAEGDMRPALAKTAKSLHALAAPYFKNVKLEKPEKMAPAPST
jgi:hypothetical protein